MVNTQKMGNLMEKGTMPDEGTPFPAADFGQTECSSQAIIRKPKLLLYQEGGGTRHNGKKTKAIHQQFCSLNLLFDVKKTTTSRDQMLREHAQVGPGNQPGPGDGCVPEQKILVCS